MMPLSHPPPHSQLATTVLPQLTPIVFPSSLIGYRYDQIRRETNEPKRAKKPSEAQQTKVNAARPPDRVELGAGFLDGHTRSTATG